MDPRFIRNFSIVAHIDHGKSTLADQLLLKSGAISLREFREQVLDDLQIERDRGITVKARAVAIHYTLDGQEYELNLIDTPGHVDFHYEVSRSLAACEGALLLVDAFQGVQAQTVANALAAINGNLVVIPVINKIDLPVTRIDEVLEEIETVVGLDATEALQVSAKQGIGIEDVFREIIRKVPHPQGHPTAPLRALVFDSKYDTYRGVVTYVRVVDGTLTPGKKMRFMRTGTTHGYGALRDARHGTGRLPDHGSQATRDGARRRHGVRSAQSACRGAARLSAAAANGLLWDVSDRRHRFRETA
jgi:GTP-binding protein LepA